MAAYYGYARVSTQKQATDGESLEVQQRMLAGHAMMSGVELRHVYVERGVSGSVPLAEREQGKALIAALRPGDAVVASRLDRVFRSALDALQMIEWFKSKKIALYLLDIGKEDVTSNGVSKMLLTILAAFAEAERERTKDRVLQVKADQKERGRYLGGYVPFGFRVDGDLVVADQAQQEAIKTAAEMREGGAALRVILERLHGDGHKISLGALHRILKVAAAGPEGSLRGR